MALSNCEEFRENRRSEWHTLVHGVNENVPCFVHLFYQILIIRYGVGIE